MSDQTVNVNNNTYSNIVNRTRAEHRLLAVHWEITYRCNEKCTHCYLDVLPPGAKVPGELSTEEAKRVIDELADLGALTISFSGGEVFLRKDIFEISRYARKKGFAIRYFTNGILIKPEIADKIAEVKPVVVELSLYGANAETHDGITKVPGSFELTLRAVELLIERGVRCLIKTPLMKENIYQIAALKQIAADLGITFQYDLTITPKHTGDLTPLQHRPSDDQLLDFLRERISADNFTPYPYNQDARFCSIGMNSFDLGPYGDVFTCVGARIPAGNVRQKPMVEIWKDSPVWEETSNLTMGNLPVCSTCELRQFCVRCHGTAAFEDGDLLGCSSVAYREARLRRKAYLDNGGH
ncbi:MAG TPA: radical SAM protein [candidate division Zixibacteria bacterium]|nr:radical SAM protein [candidate division Zixibacteria bacterium]